MDQAEYLQQQAQVRQDQETPSSELQIDVASLSDLQRVNWCKQYLSDRERGRTDLLFLCNDVLDYPDVNPEVHGPVISHLQQFIGREEYMDPDQMRIVYSEPRCNLHEAGNEGCTTTCPFRSLWYLPGARFRMLLDPRGHLKTTVNTIAHAIQWILNYPNIRILLSVASFDPQGLEIIDEIESHFRFNETFRFLYPEWCPAPERSSSWGSQKSFTVPNRKVHRKEPTMSIASVGKVVAGPHYEVIKCSDLVDEQNVKTDGGIREVKSHFRYMMPLLERGPLVEGRDLTRGWLDLEGTIYHHSDLYVTELEKDEKRIKEGRPCRFSVIRRDAIIDYKRQITLWPQRFPWAELMAIREDMDEYTFNCQYRLNPHSRSKGLADRLLLFPARFKKELLVRYRMVKCTVDLAGMEEDSDGANTVLNVCGHDKSGRTDVLDSFVGHFTPFEVIDLFFKIDTLYSTGYHKVRFQVEKAHHDQVLAPFLNQETIKRNHRIDIIHIPRDSGSSKDNRIWGTQGFWKRGQIRFSDDITCLDHIEREVFNFPNYKYKDWLDTMADQFQTEDGKLDYEVVQPDPVEKKTDLMSAYRIGKGKFIGFDPVTKQPVWDWNENDEAIYGTSGMVIGDSRVAAHMYSGGVV